MSWPLTMEELGDGICDYCPLDEDRKGSHGTPNGYISCEGCACDEAYENYLEEVAETNNGWPEDCNACPCTCADSERGYTKWTGGSRPCDVMSYADWCEQNAVPAGKDD